LKVLFVSSGRNSGVGIIVFNQGESLRTRGADISYFTINSGIRGYLSAIPKIRRLFRQGQYDLIHAHYSFSGFSAALSGCRPLIVSLMGSDTFASNWQKRLIRYFAAVIWDMVIVKSEQMKQVLKMPVAEIVPNGVNLDRFKPIDKSIAREYLNYPQGKKIVLFLANPTRVEKNHSLAFNAIRSFEDNDVELKCIYDVPNSEVPYHLGAADLLLLTSQWEGSANIIKEAMACNCPVVATKVGDVEWLLGDIPGHYISDLSLPDVVEKIKAGLEFAGNSNRTNGRQRIIELKLDSLQVADELITNYKRVISRYAGNN
jgi:teichuronic acid biosynthesis glycosyltransferase TuaC